MDFLKLDIYTVKEGIEPLTEKLEALGVSGFEIHDSDDFLEFINSNKKSWDYVGEELDPLKTQPTYISLYLTTDKQGDKQLNGIEKLLSDLKNDKIYGNLSVEKSVVREEDWANCWKEYYKPFAVGERLLIKPSWEEVSPEFAEERLVLEIDPASAFGTGQHESTRLCLELLEQAVKNGCHFLDLGSGSGILSIAALLFGAQSVILTDISENAVNTACGNIGQNGFSKDRYRAFCGDITENNELLKEIGWGFDVIAANIVADVIIKMSGLFPFLLKKGGLLIVSGIIDERLDEVVLALSKNGLAVERTRKDKGWCALTVKHKV